MREPVANSDNGVLGYLSKTYQAEMNILMLCPLQSAQIEALSM